MNINLGPGTIYGSPLDASLEKELGIRALEHHFPLSLLCFEPYLFLLMCVFIATE